MDEAKTRAIMELMAEQGILVNHGRGMFTLSPSAAAVIFREMDRLEVDFPEVEDQLMAALISCVCFFGGAKSEETAIPKREMAERAAVLRAAIRASSTTPC